MSRSRPVTGLWVMPSIVSLARLTGHLTASCMEWGEVTDRLSRRSPEGFSSPSPDRCLVSLLFRSFSLIVYSGSVCCVIVFFFYLNASVIEF